MITLDDYFMGRDVTYADALTDALRANAEVTVARANDLLSSFGEDRSVNSGWRPPVVNATTHGAAQNSRHMTCQAVDLSDPEGDLDDFCMTHLDLLEAIGLWMEHPAATKGWCHVQTVPPRSGKRVFYP